jgi:hypothetical protein
MDATNRTRGQTIMREAVIAEQEGDDARARFLYNQAAEFDTQLAEEARRRISEMDKPLVMLSTETIPYPDPVSLSIEEFIPTPELQMPPPTKTSGNIGNDARARQRAFEIEQENKRIQQEIAAENARIAAENERRQAEVDAENARRQAEVDAENARRQAEIDAENAARDEHNRQQWIQALTDSENYYRNYLATINPIELVYENKINQLLETQDFVRETLSLSFNAALVPVELRWARAVENDVNNLRAQLLATGRAEAWGLENWPQTSITIPALFTNKSGNITANAELLDENGNILGTQAFSFTWNLQVNFNNVNLTFFIDEDQLSSRTVVFEHVNINDITDILQIRIAQINGEDAESAAAQEGIQYSTDYQRWTVIEQRKIRKAEQRARKQRNQAAADNFLKSSGIGLTIYGHATSTVTINGVEKKRTMAMIGGELEFRLYRQFSLQSGITLMTRWNSAPIPYIPILAKLNLMTGNGYDSLGVFLSPYGGIGIGINPLSSSNITPIFGIELGLRILQFSVFMGGRYHENMFWDGSVFSIYAGMNYYIPFRKAKEVSE